jgi:hypothetical protein
MHTIILYIWCALSTRTGGDVINVPRDYYLRKESIKYSRRFKQLIQHTFIIRIIDIHSHA